MVAVRGMVVEAVAILQIFASPVNPTVKTFVMDSGSQVVEVEVAPVAHVDAALVHPRC